MYYVYAISSKTRKYIYVGITNNLSRRIDEHNRGYNKTTRAYRPFKLILTGVCNKNYGKGERKVFKRWFW